MHNQPAHDHHNHHTTTTDNFLNNIREAANEVAAETHNNNGDESAQNRLQRSPEAAELLRLLQRYVPYILILLVKGIYDHRAGILNFIVLLSTFICANNDLKHEIAKQQNRSWTSLLSIMCFIAGCFLFLNVMFEIHIFTTQPLSISELLWSVIVTDFVLKLITIVFKVILTCLPVRMLAFHKRVSNSFLCLQEFLLLIINIYLGKILCDGRSYISTLSLCCTNSTMDILFERNISRLRKNSRNFLICSIYYQ